MSETPSPAPAEVVTTTPSPQLNNELLARMGDEGAQRQLDAAAYLSATPNTAEEVVAVPKPHELVETAVADATDAYGVKGYKELIEDLNNTRRAHTEKMQVITKAGDIVTRSKKVEADPTKSDDLFDTLATKLAGTELTDDGLLTVLGQMDKSLQLSGDEISSLIDKIHAARLEKTQAQATAKEAEPTPTPEPTSDVFATSPEAGAQSDMGVYIDASGKPLIGIDALNNEMAKKVFEGDDANWDNLTSVLRNVIKQDAERRGAPVDERLADYDRYVARKREELETNKNGGEEQVSIPPIVEQTPHQTPEEVVANPERQRKWGRKILAGLAAAGLVLGLGFGAKKLIIDGDSSKTPDKQEQVDNGAGSEVGAPVDASGDRSDDGIGAGQEAQGQQEVAFDVVKGGGIYEQLQTGLGLSYEDAVKATNILDEAGYFNGDKILGIGHSEGQALPVPYLNGAGDGKFHFPQAAIDLLKAQGIDINQ